MGEFICGHHAVEKNFEEIRDAGAVVAYSSP